MKLSGNTILITGGTAGIGRALAERFFELKNTVIICGRREDRLAELRQKYPEIVTRQCDISDATQREELIKWVIADFPGLNILVNNAGMQLAADLTKPLDVQNVRDEIETNLVAPIHLSSLLAEHLGTQKYPAIINISSGLAFVPLAFVPIYCATKAALHSYTLSLRKQLEDTPVKVFEIAPPSTDTELGHQRRSDKTQTHGGMPIGEFVDSALQLLESDTYEAGVGPAEMMRTQRDNFFEQLNSR
jgi:uncharacterized oxidoreductase